MGYIITLTGQYLNGLPYSPGEKIFPVTSIKAVYISSNTTLSDFFGSTDNLESLDIDGQSGGERGRIWTALRTLKSMPVSASTIAGLIIENGVIDAALSEIGYIKDAPSYNEGKGIRINENNFISLKGATTSSIGGVVVDNSTLKINIETNVLSVKNPIPEFGLEDVGKMLQVKENTAHEIYLEWVSTANPIYDVNVSGYISGVNILITNENGNSIDDGLNRISKGSQLHIKNSGHELEINGEDVSNSDFYFCIRNNTTIMFRNTLTLGTNVSATVDGTAVTTGGNVVTGSTVALSATAISGMQLKHFTVGGTPIDGNTFVIKADASVEAVYEDIDDYEDIYTVTLGEHVSATVDDEPVTSGSGVPTGTTLTLSADTVQGMTFDHFTANTETIVGSTYTVESNVTIAAVYND
mgnify:CR=1 FL=1